jgi:hypothetical protein
MDVGSAGLLNLKLTPGIVVQESARERSDRQHCMPIFTPVLFRCRGDGPERLGFRARRSQMTGGRC